MTCICAVLNLSVMSNSLLPMDSSLPGASVHGDSQGKNTEMGCHALLQRIFLTQGLNPGLPHCRQFLCYLSHQGNPPPPFLTHLVVVINNKIRKCYHYCTCFAFAFFAPVLHGFMARVPLS